MPLPMVHLCVAHQAAQGSALQDKGEYYLGAIAPDAVHMRPEYVPEYKHISHLREDLRTPLSVRARRALALWQQEKEGANRDFYTGYCLHLFTDIWWLNDFYFPVFRQEYDADRQAVQDVKRAYYNDCDQLDIRLYDEYSDRPAIWQALAEATVVAVGERVSAQEVALWRDRTLNWHDGRRSSYEIPVRYTPYEALLRFIDEASKRAVQALEI